MKKILLLIILLLIPNIALARNDIIEVKLFKCTDGDTATFLYEESEIKVRFIAIDTKETKHPTKGEEPYGKVASEHTCNRLTNAKLIELEFDEKSDDTDKYNRYIAWVFVDGDNLQFELIEKGYAKVEYIYGEYKYLNELYEIEKTAKYNKVGIWGDYVEEPNYTIYYIIGGIILLIILAIIINNTNNKNIKAIARKGKPIINKEIKKLIKKL